MSLPEKCVTVGDLVEELSKFDPDTPILVIGPDGGGYDAVVHRYGFVVVNKDGSVSIDHLDYIGPGGEYWTWDIQE